MPIYLLSEQLVFPPPELARYDGLLALGGDLTPERIILAYRMGIFPWYSKGEPILWWSPDPRLVLYPNELYISKSLKKLLKQNRFAITFDKAFKDVISACSKPRPNKTDGTWLVDEMIEAYVKLHELGIAHSVEAWSGNSLAGGLYGVSIGKCFFGESMFTIENNASKAAFVFLTCQLKAWGFDFIDCQVTTDHLMRFGAVEIPRKDFLSQLNASLAHRTHQGTWHPDRNLTDIVHIAAKEDFFWN